MPERFIPFCEIDQTIARQLFHGFDSGLAIISITPLLEGCRNSNYLVHMDNCAEAFLLRIFPANDESWRKEAKLLSMLQSEVPVQQLLHLAQSEAIDGRTYGIYRFVEGITLAQALHEDFQPDELLMRDLGRILAVLHKHRYTQVGFFGEDLQVRESLPPLVTWYDLFLGPNARARLGDGLVKIIEKIVQENQDVLQEIDQRVTLVHGDFRPTNLLMHNGKLCCILDWEFAMAGHPFADLGQLFRQEECFDERLRKVFADEYNVFAEVQLPADWYRKATLRDLVNLIQMVNGSGDLPQKYAELRERILAVVREFS